MKTRILISFIYLLSYLNIFSADLLLESVSFDRAESGAARLTNLPANRIFNGSSFKFSRTQNTLGSGNAAVYLNILNEEDESFLSYERFNSLEQQVYNLPTDGRKLLIKLYSYNDLTKQWSHNDYSMRAYGGTMSGRAAKLINLPASRVFSGSSFKFIRTPCSLGSRNSPVFLRIINIKNGSILYNKPFIKLKKQVNILPVDGRRLLIKLYSYNDLTKQWSHNDYSMRAYGGTMSGRAAKLINLPASRVFSGSSFTFTRTPCSLGSENSPVFLRIINIKDSSILYNKPFIKLQKQVNILPVDGSRLHIILFSFNYRTRQWSRNDYGMIAYGAAPSEQAAKLINLPASRTFDGISFKFTRTANTLGSENSPVFLRIINIKNGSILYNKPFIKLQKQVNILPVDGSRLHIILFSFNYRTRQWSRNDYGMIAYGAAPSEQAAKLTNLPASRTFDGISFKFTRTANTLGSENSPVFLRIINIKNGSILYNKPFIKLQKQVNILPVDGSRLHIILFSFNYRTRQWSRNDYGMIAYGAAPSEQAAKLTNLPASGAFGGNSFKFTRTANTLGSGNSPVFLQIINIKDGSRLYFNRFNGLDLQVTGLPTDGRRLHILLFSFNDRTRQWNLNHYKMAAYGAAPSGQAAKLTNLPASGAFGGSSFTFTRTANTLGSENSVVFLQIINKEDRTLLYNKPFISLEKQVNILPVNGKKLLIKLYSFNDRTRKWSRNEYIIFAYGATMGGQAAKLTNLPASGAFGGNSFKFTRTANTLGSENSPVVLRIFNEVDFNLLYNKPFNSIEQQVTGLPTDGRKLLIVLYSLNDRTRQWSRKIYNILAYGGTPGGQAPRLTNLPASGVFSGTTFTFVRTPSTLGSHYSINLPGSGSFYGNFFRFSRSSGTLGIQNSAVFLQIINEEDFTRIYNQPFISLEQHVIGLPDDGRRLLIVLSTYNYITRQWSHKIYNMLAWTRPAPTGSEARLTNPEFLGDKWPTFTSGTYTFERTANTLGGQINGKVQIRIVKVVSSGEIELEEVVKQQDFHADGFTVNNLPTDGSTLKISLYSYNSEGTSIVETLTYFVTTYKQPAPTGTAAVLTNPDFVNNDADNPHIFESNTYTFRRTANSLDGQDTGGDVKIRIVRVDSSGSESDIIPARDFPATGYYTSSLPTNGESLKIYVYSYKKDGSYDTDGTKIYFATAWTRPQPSDTAARLTSPDFSQGRPTLPSGTYTFERTANTLGGQINGKVQIRIVKVVSSGEIELEEVVKQQDFHADGFTVNNLPTDGSTLKISLYSYNSEGTSIVETLTYFVTTYKQPAPTGTAAVLTNPDFVNNDADNPHIFESNTYTFRRTANSLDGQDTGGDVKIRIVRVDSSGSESDIIPARDFPATGYYTSSLPTNGESLKIYVYSYKKDGSYDTDGTKIYFATAWTRPQPSDTAARLTSPDFSQGRPTLPSGTYTFERTANTLGGQINGKVQIRIVKVVSSGEIELEEVVKQQDFHADGFTVNNLPTDGSTLKISLYSYNSEGTSIVETLTYFVTTYKQPAPTGTAAVLTNPDFVNNDADNPHIFESNTYTFRRTANSLDGQDTGGDVKIRIVRVDSSGSESDIIPARDFPATGYYTSSLPTNGESLKIYVYSYKKDGSYDTDGTKIYLDRKSVV